MAKKHRNLIERITAADNMRRAYVRTARGRRLTYGALEFKEYAEVNLARLSDEISAGHYRPDPVRQFAIYEPKERLITALSFRDRVAQHALVALIGPIFDAALMPRTYACRPGRGTHAGVIALQSELRHLGEPVHVLKTDFSRFFPSIDRAVLHGLIRRKIACRATLRLIDAMVPPSGTGLPIGSLTSQIFANVYGGAMDRLLHFDLGERHWHRYMDDIVVLGHDAARLHRVREAMERFAAERLKLRFSKWSVAPARRGINFLGYRIWPTHKLLRRQSVIRAKRMISRLGRREDKTALTHFVAAWSGHAQWADTHNIMRALGLQKETRPC